jgi:hypothetical protein
LKRNPAPERDRWTFYEIIIHYYAMKKNPEKRGCLSRFGNYPERKKHANPASAGVRSIRHGKLVPAKRPPP